MADKPIIPPVHPWSPPKDLLGGEGEIDPNTGKPIRYAQDGRPVQRNGRRTILTDELHEQIVGLLRLGNYLHVAAAACGIGEQTISTWVRKGEEFMSAAESEDRDHYAYEVPFVRLAIDVKKARAMAQAKALHNIRRAAESGNWQADAWFLERTDPQHYSRTQRTEISGPDGGVIEVDAVTLNRKLEAVMDNMMRTTQAALGESTDDTSDGADQSDDAPVGTVDADLVESPVVDAADTGDENG